METLERQRTNPITQISADSLYIRDDRSKRVKLVCEFYDESWCKNRSVTSLDWSPKFPELSVAAYNKNGMSITDPNGIACVWNLHLVDRPEFVFHSQVSLWYKSSRLLALSGAAVGCTFSSFFPVPSQSSYRRYIRRSNSHLGYKVKIATSPEVAA